MLLLDILGCFKYLVMIFWQLSLFFQLLQSILSVLDTLTNCFYFLCCRG